MLSETARLVQCKQLDWMFGSCGHILILGLWEGFSGGLDCKDSACSVGNPGLIPGSGRSLEEEMAIHSSSLAWRIPWTEEPGRLSPGGCEESDTTE